MSSSSTTRFSDRVADYVKYRPSYPPEAIDAIVKAAHLAPGACIADVGSGTGISARPFLERGYEVVGVEPNAEMRAAGDAELSSFPRFRSIDGTAEHTALGDGSVALVLAAQAFHWFRRDEARSEMRRILAPPHYVALVWNERLVDTPFLRDYEAALLAHAPDYAKVNHANITEADIGRFFGHETFTFANAQKFDREGFLGRARSSSYVPKENAQMMRALGDLFTKHAMDGVVEFRYLTSVHVGNV